MFEPSAEVISTSMFVTPVFSGTGVFGGFPLIEMAFLGSGATAVIVAAVTLQGSRPYRQISKVSMKNT